MQDADEKKRKAASQALAKTFKENLRTFTLITNTLAKDKEISDRWRGFKDVADARHLSNRVEPEVVEALVAAVRAAYPRLSHRYYALKARLVRQEEAAALGPQRAAAEGRRSARSAGTRRATRCSTAYAGFSPRMAEIAEQLLRRAAGSMRRRGPARRPARSRIRPCRRRIPYVLINYQGKPRDVMTLAHELGHGVHQVLAAPNGALMAPTPLTLAETASVFGEMLTFKTLLAETTDVRARKAMLAAKVEDMINTVVRQIAFYTFERKVHTERRNGETDRRPALRDLDERAGREPRARDRAEARLRDVLDLHPALHPLAVLRLRLCVRRLPGELALRRLREGVVHGFAERYLAMLAAGGTKHHSELLAPFGLDARDPAFWQGGLGVIERLIDELEAIDA